MRKWLNNYFDLTKGEFNGLLFLIGLIITVACCPLVLDWLRPMENNPEQDVRMIRELERRMAEQPAAGLKKKFLNNRKPQKKVSLFYFDPNTASVQDWEKLGFSARQAQSIVNYCLKGGVFREPADLKKMYVVSAERFEQLAPYINIKTSVAVKRTIAGDRKGSYERPLPVCIEINAADTLELDKIRGIGPAFARRIVKYRERLGGFYKREQLMEVFGLDSAKFQEIRDQVRIDASLIRKFRINSVQFEELKLCPYLRYQQVNAIIQYRKQHGNYANIAGLKKVAVLTPQLLEKLEPYLIFNDD